MTPRIMGGTLAISMGLAALPVGGAPAPEVIGLEGGRAVWLGTCQVCHAEPDSGAPQLGDGEAWKPRAAQGAAVLYAHALNGHVGPKGNEMPPRGGNPGLSDAEVKAAVDYMLKASIR